MLTGLLRCQQSLQELGVSIVFEHVRRHQAIAVGHHLSFMEELNVGVDAVAQQYNGQVRAEGIRPLDGVIFGEIGPLWINTPDKGRVKITTDLVNVTHDLFHATMIRQYWMEHDLVASTAEVKIL